MGWTLTPEGASRTLSGIYRLDDHDHGWMITVELAVVSRETLVELHAAITDQVIPSIEADVVRLDNANWGPL